MKPITFPEHNCVYAKGQEEYSNLPAHRNVDGTVTTCWELSFMDKVRILFLGVVWLQVLTHGRSLQPLYLSTNKNDVEQSIKQD